MAVSIGQTALTRGADNCDYSTEHGVLMGVGLPWWQTIQKLSSQNKRGPVLCVSPKRTYATLWFFRFRGIFGDPPRSTIFLLWRRPRSYVSFACITEPRVSLLCRLFVPTLFHIHCHCHSAILQPIAAANFEKPGVDSLQEGRHRYRYLIESTWSWFVCMQARKPRFTAPACSRSRRGTHCASRKHQNSTQARSQRNKA